MRALGRTGLVLPGLGLGTSHLASLGNPQGVAAMARLLEAAYEHGLRLFDTANIYGQGDAERLLSRIAGREGVVICTKAGLSVGRWQPVVRTLKPLLRPMVARSSRLRGESSITRKKSERHELDPVHIEAALNDSLRRLRREHVDIFLLHSPPVAALHDGVLLDLLARLRAAGKARSVGVSVQAVQDVPQVLALGGVDVLQVPLPAQSLKAASPLLHAAQEAGVGVIAREVLSGAVAPQNALTSVLGHSGVNLALVGTTSARHLAENVALMRQVAGNG